MVNFGAPPDPARPPNPYPGVSGTRFNPVEAQKCWAVAVRKEKESRNVHQLLDAHNKLGLDEKWARGTRLKADILPGRESLQRAYKKTGWKQVGRNGRLVAPDPHKLIAQKTQKKRQHNVASNDCISQAELDLYTWKPPARSASLSSLAAMSWGLHSAAEDHVPEDVTSTCKTSEKHTSIGSKLASRIPAAAEAVTNGKPRRKSLSKGARKEKLVNMVRKTLAHELATMVETASVPADTKIRLQASASAPVFRTAARAASRKPAQPRVPERGR